MRKISVAARSWPAPPPLRRSLAALLLAAALSAAPTPTFAQTGAGSGATGGASVGEGGDAAGTGGAETASPAPESIDGDFGDSSTTGDLGFGDPDADSAMPEQGSSAAGRAGTGGCPPCNCNSGQAAPGTAGGDFGDGATPSPSPRPTDPFAPAPQITPGRSQ
jgi:hypothetical protein